MAQAITFEYTNWEGKVSTRHVEVDRLVWLDDPGFGYEPGVFLIGRDMDKEGKPFRQFSPARMRPALADESRVPFSGAGVNILATIR